MREKLLLKEDWRDLLEESFSMNMIIWKGLTLLKGVDIMKRGKYVL